MKKIIILNLIFSILTSSADDLYFRNETPYQVYFDLDANSIHFGGSCDYHLDGPLNPHAEIFGGNCGSSRCCGQQYRRAKIQIVGHSETSVGLPSDSSLILKKGDYGIKATLQDNKFCIQIQSIGAKKDSQGRWHEWSDPNCVSLKQPFEAKTMGGGLGKPYPADIISSK